MHLSEIVLELDELMLLHDHATIVFGLFSHEHILGFRLAPEGDGCLMEALREVFK